MTNSTVPPGSPGIRPRWTSSAKSAVGTAARSESRVWFTISHGILNEIYSPRLDTACIRDFGFIVTAKDYFSEEKRHTRSTVAMIEDGVPAFRLVNASLDGRYRISKTVFSDPVREVVLQDIRFEALVGALSDYQLHTIIAPHLVNAGADNTGWCGDFKGHDLCGGYRTVAQARNRRLLHAHRLFRGRCPRQIAWTDSDSQPLGG